MTGSTAIDLMVLLFSAVSVAGIGALLWRYRVGLPKQIATRDQRRIVEHRAALAALSNAYRRAPSEALRRNYRWHREALLRLEPKADTEGMDVAFDVPLSRAA